MSRSHSRSGSSGSSSRVTALARVMDPDEDPYTGVPSLRGRSPPAATAAYHSRPSGVFRPGGAAGADGAGFPEFTAIFSAIIRRALSTEPIPIIPLQLQPSGKH